MIDKTQNENITMKEEPIPLSLKITDIDISKNRPIPHDVKLDIHSEQNSLFSQEIIIIPFIYYSPTDKKKYSWEVRKTYKSFRNLLSFIEELLPTRKYFLNLKKTKYKKNQLEIRRQKEKTLPINYKEQFYTIYRMNFNKNQYLFFPAQQIPFTQ